MKHKEGLIDLLYTENRRTSALMLMQWSINRKRFESAMKYQFMYLYWVDECNRLHERFSSEYWDLRFMATGESI